MQRRELLKSLVALVASMRLKLPLGFHKRTVASVHVEGPPAHCPYCDRKTLFIDNRTEFHACTNCGAGWHYD